MKLVRFTVDGRTRLGAVMGDEVADLSAVDPTLPTDVGEALAAGLLPGLDHLAGRAPRQRLGDVRLEDPSQCRRRFWPSGSTTGPTPTNRACRPRCAGVLQQGDHVRDRP